MQLEFAEAVTSAILEADLTVASIGSGVGRQHGSDDSDDSEGDSQDNRLRRMLGAVVADNGEKAA